MNLECFIDEIAHATGKDPLALRRELMKNHPKHLSVLDAAAEHAGWGRPAPDVNGQKVFRGLCQTHGFGSYVAACAEISVSRDGVLKVHRIVAATYPRQRRQTRSRSRELFAYGSDELTALELFLVQSASGMRLESPAVRP